MKQGRIVHRSGLKNQDKQINKQILPFDLKISICVKYIFWQIFKEIVENQNLNMYIGGKTTFEKSFEKS